MLERVNGKTPSFFSSITTSISKRLLKTATICANIRRVAERLVCDEKTRTANPTEVPFYTHEEDEKEVEKDELEEEEAESEFGGGVTTVN